LQVLNKYDKEQLVIKLHQEGKTMREVSHIVHMSFGNIGKIIQRIEGRDEDTNISNKSKATQAMFLFKSGKKAIEVAIELDISASEVEDILREYWLLNQLEELGLVYYEVKNYLEIFLILFHTLKKNKSINQKNIERLLRYAVYDLPSLENRIRRLSNDVIDMEWRKKELRDEVAKLNSQLEQTQKRYQMEIELKKEIISNLDRQINQKINALEEKQTNESITLGS
jgi:hypothetical protein